MLAPAPVQVGTGFKPASYRRGLRISIGRFISRNAAMVCLKRLKTKVEFSVQEVIMASRHYRTLRLKIVFVTLFFSLIPLFALGATIYYLFDTAYGNKNLEGLRTLAQTRRSAIELFFDERISQLTTIANTHSLETVQSETYLKGVFDIMQARSKSFIDLGVIDDAGNHLAYVGPYHEKLKRGELRPRRLVSGSDVIRGVCE